MKGKIHFQHQQGGDNLRSHAEKGRGAWFKFPRAWGPRRNVARSPAIRRVDAALAASILWVGILEARRRRAVKLLGEGWLITDVAAAVGASRQSVSTWRKLAGTRGEKARALAAKPQHVPQCRLSEKQRARLVKLLRAGPRKAGWGSDLWTTQRVAELIERELGCRTTPRMPGV